MKFITMRPLLRALRSFLTIPGAISLSGIVVAVLVHNVVPYFSWDNADLVPAAFKVPPDTARAVLTTTATASFSALVMVYSIVLLIYTMAATSIGPRLLQRFRDDRINQIAVGALGATFLYCVFGLWLIREDSLLHLTAAIALVYATTSIIMLLYFVNAVSGRVTIDQEAAAIAASLDEQISDALKNSQPIRPEELVLPTGTERQVRSGRSGYVDTITGDGLARAAREAGVVVVYTARPGDFVMAGEVLATVFGDTGESFDETVVDAAPLIAARDPIGDLRFSVDLLVEIALRALSPGVNDTFTAIGCIDRLSASLSRARDLSMGVVMDKEGVARVVFPRVDAELLFQEAFPPLRRAGRGNGLMTQALTRALLRMAMAAPSDAREMMLAEMQRLRDDLDGCGLPGGDLADLAGKIDQAISDATPDPDP